MADPCQAERDAVLSHLRRSIAAKRAHRPGQDSGTQRRVTDGQIRILEALVREIGAGLHRLHAGAEASNG